MSMCPTTVHQLLTIEDLVVKFPVAGGTREAVAGVSFMIARGEIVGLVGESGCGKSSLARAIMQIPRPASGRVLLDGVDLTRLHGNELRRIRNRMQMIFQEPLASLNPLKTIGDSVAFPLRVAGGATPDAIRLQSCEALAAVGLDPDQFYHRTPARLSGGQCQRAAIARALVNRPELLVCDEPTASLDVSVQAQIINLLQDLNQSCRLSLLFISHDLALVKHISHRVAVMYQGRLCELAPCATLFDAPLHPYTGALIAAASGSTPRGSAAPPTHGDSSAGCRFYSACSRAASSCRQQPPELRQIRPEHWVACHIPN